MNRNGSRAAAEAEPPLRNVNRHAEDVEPDPEEEEDHVLLQNNDPDLDELWIGAHPGEFVPHPDDWGRTGEYIGRNTHLDHLHLRYLDYYDTGEVEVAAEGHQLEALCKGIARNISITKMTVFQHPFGGIEFTALVPFFKNNTLKYLNLGDDTEFNGPTTCLIANALASFRSLETFHFQGWKPGSDLVKSLIKSLSRHKNLKELWLCGGELFVGRKALRALTTYLGSPKCLLTKFTLVDDLDDGAAMQLGIALASNHHIEDLELMNMGSVKSAGWVALSMSVGCSNLKRLALVGNYLSGDALTALALNLGHRNTVKTLDLSRSLSRADMDGWFSFSVYLRSPNCSVEELSLNSNFLSDMHLTSSGNALAHALAENKSIRHLDLGDNDHISTSGWETFFTLLEKNAVIEWFSLPHLDDRAMTRFARLLSGNKSIKRVRSDSRVVNNDNRRTKLGWESFATALCNKDSVMSTFSSNHSLQSINESELQELPDDLVEVLKSSLEINEAFKHHSLLVRARAKILEHHFSATSQEQERLVVPFASMPTEVLPHALAWVGIVGCGKYDLIAMNLMHMLVKSRPDLFDFADRNASASHRKRKRFSQQRTIESYFSSRTE